MSLNLRPGTTFSPPAGAAYSCFALEASAAGVARSRGALATDFDAASPAAALFAVTGGVAGRGAFANAAACSTTGAAVVGCAAAGVADGGVAASGVAGGACG